MLLSRREVLAGTAAAVSILGVPAALALPSSHDEPALPPGVPPVLRPAYFFEPCSMNAPPIAILTLYKNDFGDGRIRYDGNRVPLDRLAWVYESYNYCYSPFSLRDAWRLFEAANHTDHAEAGHRDHLAGLMRDRRKAFFLPDHVANALGVYLMGCLLFERSRDWISFTSYSKSSCWMDQSPSGCSGSVAVRANRLAHPFFGASGQPVILRSRHALGSTPERSRSHPAGRSAAEDRALRG